MLFEKVPSSLFSHFPCQTELHNVPESWRAWRPQRGNITVERQTPNLPCIYVKTVLISVLSHTGGYHQAVKTQSMEVYQNQSNQIRVGECNTEFSKTLHSFSLGIVSRTNLPAT